MTGIIFVQKTGNLSVKKAVIYQENRIITVARTGIYQLRKLEYISQEAGK